MRTFVLIVRTSNHHRTVPGTVYLLLFYFSNSLGGRVDEGGLRVDRGVRGGRGWTEGGPRGPWCDCVIPEEVGRDVGESGSLRGQARRWFTPVRVEHRLLSLLPCRVSV